MLWKSDVVCDCTFMQVLPPALGGHLSYDLQLGLVHKLEIGSHGINPRTAHHTWARYWGMFQDNLERPQRA